MNLRNTVLYGILLVMLAEQSSGFFDPLTGGAFAGLASALYYGYQRYTICDREECCTDKYITKDIDNLRSIMGRRLFGQHIAAQTVLSALSAHVSSYSPPKALTMSFHGSGGSGKNYVATMIVENYYRYDTKSKYYYFYNGRVDFPVEGQLQIYKERLRKEIINALVKCPESIFVFDEVDMMIPGVLNALVPFLDYGKTRVYHEGDYKWIKTNRAIFIFLSNTGSQEILKTLMELWQQGKSRNETTLSDFENLISTGAFNERGGLYKSDTISTSLIDHYVPFLPLEAEHVILCIKKAFRDRGKEPTPELIREAMSYVTFGPPPHNLYAKSGCRRVDQKVASILYRRD